MKATVSREDNAFFETKSDSVVACCPRSTKKLGQIVSVY